MEVNGEQATYPNGHPQDDGGRAAGARCGQAAETRIRLRLRRRQEPAEVGADGAGTDGSGSTAAALEAAAAYRRGRGGGGSESAAALVATAARQHAHRTQQAPRECQVCGELGLHGEMGLCTACRGAAATCAVCYDHKCTLCICIG